MLLQALATRRCSPAKKIAWPPEGLRREPECTMMGPAPCTALQCKWRWALRRLSVEPAMLLWPAHSCRAPHGSCAGPALCPSGRFRRQQRRRIPEAPREPRYEKVRALWLLAEVGLRPRWSLPQTPGWPRASGGPKGQASGLLFEEALRQKPRHYGSFPIERPALQEMPPKPSASTDAVSSLLPSWRRV